MPTQTKNSPPLKTPKLRFPGFEGAWEKKNLGEVAKFYSGGTPLSSKREYYKGTIPFIKSGEISAYKTEQYISNEALESSSAKLVEVGDILYALYGATSGAVAISKISGAINQAVLCIRTDQDRSWVFHYLSYQKASILAKYLQGGQGNLSADIIKNLKVSFPSLVEQHKVAGFLDKIDEWVQNLREQKEFLEVYKKGIMQKIFSQEIRFKDENGKDFPAWEEKKLGQVFDFLPTNSYSREQLTYVGGEVKNIHYGDIHTKFKTSFNINKEDVPYLTSAIDSSKIKPELFCQEGDVVMADASEDYKDIGKSIELIRLNGEKVVAGLHTLLLRTKHGVVLEVGFSGYLMQTHAIREQIMKMATGVSVLGIGKTNLVKVKLALPSLAEQQKLAQFFTSLDNLIESKQKQITEAETWKKGLTQELFV